MVRYLILTKRYIKLWNIWNYNVFLKIVMLQIIKEWTGLEMDPVWCVSKSRLYPKVLFEVFTGCLCYGLVNTKAGNTCLCMTVKNQLCVCWMTLCVILNAGFMMCEIFWVRSWCFFKGIFLCVVLCQKAEKGDASWSLDFHLV